MKANIHPTYFPNATIVCACGATYTTGSIKERIDIELCASCHPFFTGKQKIIDTARRVEKFTGRVSAKTATLSAKGKAAERAARAKEKEEKRSNRSTPSSKTSR